MNISIETFLPEHADQFAELNREWLLRYNLLELSDEEQLVGPQTHSIQSAGQIFVALLQGQVVVPASGSHSRRCRCDPHPRPWRRAVGSR